MKHKKLFSVLASALCLCIAAALFVPGLFKTEAAGDTVSISGGSAIFSYSEMFSKRDLEQTADTGEATYYELMSGQDVHITKAGVYMLSGSASGTTVYVEAGDEDKVQIVLSGASISNTNFPCIYVKNADKVFVTTSSDSALSVSGKFTSDGSTNTDGVIFSKSDLTLNGTAKLSIASSDNGIVGKDDLKITGGTYEIKAASKCVEANDSVRVCGGSFTLTAGTDALHAESEDVSKGYVFISGGTFQIKASDDGIHASSILQIDDGSLNISAAEGLEATYIQLNGGSIAISASDDGINAARKVSGYTPTVEINGGEISVNMGAGDTDGVDSNGNIVINGGVISVYGNSTFDYDGTGVINGGTVYCNGQQVSTLPNQFMGGRGGWGSQGGWGNPGGWGNQGGRGGRGR